MVMEWISAGPIHETDIGIDPLLTVIVECLPRLKQHVGDACAGNKGFDVIFPLRQHRPRSGSKALPSIFAVP